MVDHTLRDNKPFSQRPHLVWLSLLDVLWDLCGQSGEHSLLNSWADHSSRPMSHPSHPSLLQPHLWRKWSWYAHREDRSMPFLFPSGLYLHGSSRSGRAPGWDHPPQQCVSKCISITTIVADTHRVIWALTTSSLSYQQQWLARQAGDATLHSPLHDKHRLLAMYCAIDYITWKW